MGLWIDVLQPLGEKIAAAAEDKVVGLVRLGGLAEPGFDRGEFFRIETEIGGSFFFPIYAGEYAFG